MSAPFSRLVRDIKSLIRAADRLDARSVELDIRARWHEAQAGLRWSLSREKIIAQCDDELGITEAKWCSDKLGCHISTMRLRVQLHRHWQEYVRKRRAEGANEQWGLRYALSLIPVNRRYAMKSPPARDHFVHDESPAEAKLDLSRCQFLTGDALEVLRSLPSNSVQCIVTSPPFWPLRRSYGGFGIGYETTLQEYIANLLAVFRECKRVLRKDGLLWLHLEDAYSRGGSAWRPDSFKAFRPNPQKKLIEEGFHVQSTTYLRPAKCLLMFPALVALALMDDGWWLRSHVIWDKGFARPDSADDRPTVSHGELFLLSKAAHYTYDSDPIRVPYTAPSAGRSLSPLPRHERTGLLRREVARDMRVYANPLGRNSGTVWRCKVANYRGTHSASIPPALVKPMILTGCTRANDLVLDPFGGSGTVAMVALQLGFKAMTIDIFDQYTQEARHRLAQAPASCDDEVDAGDEQLAAD